MPEIFFGYHMPSFSFPEVATERLFDSRRGRCGWWPKYADMSHRFASSLDELKRMLSQHWPVRILLSAAGMQRYDVATQDPVCGKPVEQQLPELRTEYADIIYYFCSRQCLDRFIEQPDIFTAQPGKGNVAEDDRALRNDDHEGQLAPDAAARVPHEPPAADPGG
jgi:YHS domain-containing protein